jgi:DNA replication protein DnaC
MDHEKPQQIANLSEQALREITSLSKSSNPLHLFATIEEADAAYSAHQDAVNRRQRLFAAGYPHRHVGRLETMQGPSLRKAGELWPRVESNGIVFLIGDRGPGKTQMATWFAWQMLKSSRSCGRYIKLADLFGELKATWGGRGDKSEAKILDSYFKTKFLVIDEAQERGSGDNDRDWCDRVLTNLIDHRYDSMFPTVLCANYQLDSYAGQVPAAMRSRIVETGGLVLCDWESYRA